MRKVPSECPDLDGRWRRSSWGWRRSSHCMAQVLPLHGQVQRFAGVGHPIALVRPLSPGAGLHGDGAGPEVSWRRSVFIDGTCAANVASVLSNGAGLHHFFGPAPGCLGTCAGQLGDLRRTVRGSAPYRGGGFRVPRLFNAAALFSVSLSVPPFCAPLLPPSLCPSASLRSVLLCGPLLFAPLRPSALCSSAALCSVLSASISAAARRRAWQC